MALLQVKNDDKMKLDRIRWGGDYRVLFHMLNTVYWFGWANMMSPGLDWLHIIDGAKGFVCAQVLYK